MEELEKALVLKYGLKVDAMQSHMEGHVVYAGGSEKYFRKNDYSANRIVFIHGAKEHLAKRGVRNIDRFICTLDGEPFVEINDTVYTLTEKIKGKECDFYDMDRLYDAIKVIARMHIASAGYTVSGNGFVRSSLGTLPERYKKKLREIKKLKNSAQRGKTTFDRIYSAVADDFSAQGDAALERLSGVPYNKIVQKAFGERMFCHGDLSHRNIIFGEKGIYMKGFEYCRYDVRVSDIVDFVRKRLKKCGWSADDAAFLIDEYALVGQIEKVELEVIKGMLQFPYTFWELANRFYNSKRSWAQRAYTPKMKELAASLKEIRGFNEKLDAILR